MMVNEKDGAFYSRQSVITDPKQYAKWHPGWKAYQRELKAAGQESKV